MVIQGDAAFWVHPVPIINSLNERDAVSDFPFQVKNEYFGTSVSLKKREEIPFLLEPLGSFISESSLVRCAE